MSGTPCSFNELDEILRRADAESGAAEAHGLLCGSITAQGRSHTDAWLAHLLGDGNTLSTAAQDCAELLDALQADILARFNDQSFGFSVLLPPDTAPLSVRTRALGEWCSGYLYGLALGGVREGQVPGEHVQEVMKDFYEISHAGFATDAPDEGDETAFAEIVEYIRVSVLMLHEELHAMPTSSRVH